MYLLGLFVADLFACFPANIGGLPEVAAADETLMALVPGTAGLELMTAAGGLAHLRRLRFRLCCHLLRTLHFGPPMLPLAVDALPELLARPVYRALNSPFLFVICAVVKLILPLWVQMSSY